MSPDVLALLPFWLPYAPPLLSVGCSLVAAFILGQLSFSLGFRAFLKAGTVHWTEKARLSWGGRSIFGTFIFVLPILLGLVVAFATGRVSVVPGWLNGMLAGLTWVVVSFYFARKIGLLLGFPAVPLGNDIRSFVAGFYRLILVIGLLGLVLYLANRAIRGEVWLGLVALGLAPFLVRRELLLFGRPFGLLSPPDARLQGVVDRAAQKVGIRPTSVDVLESNAPNAFALLFSNAILVTRRLLEIMDDTLLETIIAHELGHLQESRWVRLRRLAPLTAILVGGLILLNIPSDYLLEAYVIFVLVLAGIVVVNRRLGRAMETQADHAAMEASQALQYATALEVLYRENLIPAHQKGGIHPSLYDRMVTAGCTPDWPRPALPDLGGMWAMLGIYATILVVGAFSHVMAWTFLEGQSLYVFNLVEGHQEAWTLGQLASTVEDANDAVVLYREAEAIAYDDPFFSAAYGITLANVGRCAEAQEAVRRADVRLKAWEEPGAWNWVEDAVVTAHQAADQCVPL